MTCDCGCAIEGTHTTYIYICVCTPIHPFSVDDAVNSEAGREGKREGEEREVKERTHPRTCGLINKNDYGIFMTGSLFLYVIDE